MAERHPKSIFGQVGQTHMGAAIDAIFLKQNANETDFQMSEVFQYSDKEIQDFREMLNNFCIKLSWALKSNEIYKEGILNGLCEQKWGRCAFWVPCKVNGDSAVKAMLDRNFVRKVYDPLHFND